MKQTRQAKALRKPVQEPTPGARPPSRPTRTGDDGRPTEPRNVPFPVARPRAEAALTDAAAYVAAIRAAFLEEAHLRARELAAEGHQCFPDDPELARYMNTLPPAQLASVEIRRKGYLWEFNYGEQFVLSIGSMGILTSWRKLPHDLEACAFGPPQKPDPGLLPEPQGKAIRKTPL